MQSHDRSCKNRKIRNQWACSDRFSVAVLRKSLTDVCLRRQCVLPKCNKEIKGKWKEKNRKRKKDGEWDHESNHCWMRDESNLNITSQRPKPLLERLNFSVTKEFLPVEGRLAKLNISYTDTRINSTNEQLYFTRNFRLQTCAYKSFNFTFQTLTAQ